MPANLDQERFGLKHFGSTATRSPPVWYTLVRNSCCVGAAKSAQKAGPRVRPAPGGEATRGLADLPDDVAMLLREGTSVATPPGAQPADPSPSVRAGLVERLGRLDEASPAAPLGPAARAAVEASKGA